MNANKRTGVMNVAASRLRRGLFEDSRDSAEPMPRDIVQQVLADIARGATAPIIDQDIRVGLGGAASGTMVTGVPGGLDGSEASIEVRVEVGGGNIEFMINGAVVATCRSSLQGYNRALSDVQKAIELARIDATDQSNRLSATPNYGNMLRGRLGGSY